LRRRAAARFDLRRLLRIEANLVARPDAPRAGLPGWKRRRHIRVSASSTSARVSGHSTAVQSRTHTAPTSAMTGSPESVVIQPAARCVRGSLAGISSYSSTVREAPCSIATQRAIAGSQPSGVGFTEALEQCVARQQRGRAPARRGAHRREAHARVYRPCADLALPRGHGPILRGAPFVGARHVAGARADRSRPRRDCRQTSGMEALGSRAVAAPVAQIKETVWRAPPPRCPTHRAAELN